MEVKMTIQAILADKGSEVATVRQEQTVAEAIATLGERRIGALPVLDDRKVVGIMSERDIIYCLRDHGAEVLDWPVSKLMTSPAVTVDPSMPVLRALVIMTQRRMRHLPVVSGDTICGIVSIGDLVKYRMEKIEQEAEAMRSYIQSA
jgi:CBS domain-containing protein